MNRKNQDENFFCLHPHEVAVVMIDFQNDFCSPQVFPPGHQVTNTHNAATAQRANLFARQATDLGAHVIYTQQILDFEHLTPRQRRWEQPDGLCAVGSWGAELFIEPIPGSSIVTKYRFDCWQSQPFVQLLEAKGVEGLVICGVELVCCVLFAVLGASERGYQYLVPRDLVSGQDTGDSSDNKAVRDFLDSNQPHRIVESSDTILARWLAMQDSVDTRD